MQEKSFISFNNGIRHRSSHHFLYGLAFFVAILASSLIGESSVSAASCDDSSTSCVEVKFGQPTGSLSVDPVLPTMLLLSSISRSRLV